jgi:hypothetical protein
MNHVVVKFTMHQLIMGLNNLNDGNNTMIDHLKAMNPNDPNDNAKYNNTRQNLSFTTRSLNGRNRTINTYAGGAKAITKYTDDQVRYVHPRGKGQFKINITGPNHPGRANKHLHVNEFPINIKRIKMGLVPFPGSFGDLTQARIFADRNIILLFGPESLLNFPLSNYQEEIDEYNAMHHPEHRVFVPYSLNQAMLDIHAYTSAKWRQYGRDAQDAIIYLRNNPQLFLYNCPENMSDERVASNDGICIQECTGKMGKGVFFKYNESCKHIVSMYRWNYSAQTGYVCTFINGKTISLHRLLMCVTDPNIMVDHHNGDRLDYTLFNLKLTDFNRNANNRKKATSIKGKAPSSVKYNGVSRNDRYVNVWKAKINYMGIACRIGNFKHQSYAARAYNYVAKRLLGNNRDLHVVEDETIEKILEEESDSE